MELSLYDLVVDEMLARQKDVRAELAQRFKKTKPFRMEEVPKDEMLYEYNTMTPEKFNTLLNTYGREAMNEMVYKMETLKKKRRGGEQ